MAFKLRSGNSPIFKKVGSEKESVEEYNTRMREQYEDRMQSYADSTTAYENKKEYIKKLSEVQELRGDMVGIEHENRVVLDWVDGSESTRGTKEWDERAGKRKLTNEELVKNFEWNELRHKSYLLTKEGMAAYKRNLELGIHTKEGGDYKNPNDLRPTMPRKPLTKISVNPLKIFPIDSGGDKIELVKSKRKYVTSADGKTKTNIETGEVTKVKTKVKRKRRPGKRKVRNLVTGGWNWIQG
tara:strand:+ start:547 stop:1269 length:723 start_codon:yes stop_codon:yes gene_type:complete